MAKIKYGIKVPLAVDDYVWVCNPGADAAWFDPEPVLYNSRQEAEERAKIWGPLARVESFQLDNT